VHGRECSWGFGVLEDELFDELNQEEQQHLRVTLMTVKHAERSLRGVSGSMRSLSCQSPCSTHMCGKAWHKGVVSLQMALQWARGPDDGDDDDAHGVQSALLFSMTTTFKLKTENRNTQEKFQRKCFRMLTSSDDVSPKKDKICKLPALLQ
jgi:hypothetical protein